MRQEARVYRSRTPTDKAHGIMFTGEDMAGAKLTA